MFRRLSPESLRSLDARRICIIKPSAFGDVVQTLPLLGVLRERFPQAEISWVIQRGLAGLVERHPLLDRVLIFEKSGFGNWRRLWNELRSAQFDLSIDLQGLLRTALMTKAAAAPVRVGLQSAREGANLVCNLIVPDTSRLTPAHQRYWRVADWLGCGESARQTVVPIDDADLRWAGEQLAELPQPLLAVNSGARWETKRWPPEKFAAVASKAARRFGCSIVLLGDASEVPLTEHLARVLGQLAPNAAVRNLAGQTTIGRLAAVLQRADVMLTNDSGPMHLAAGLGVPVVGIFTCTDSVRSGPPGEQHEFVRTQLSCAGRYKKRCPYRGKKHLACMEEVTAERVWQALVQVIERTQPGSIAA